MEPGASRTPRAASRRMAFAGTMGQRIAQSRLRRLEQGWAKPVSWLQKRLEKGKRLAVRSMGGATKASGAVLPPDEDGTEQVDAEDPVAVAVEAGGGDGAGALPEGGRRQGLGGREVGSGGDGAGVDDGQRQQGKGRGQDG